MGDFCRKLLTDNKYSERLNIRGHRIKRVHIDKRVPNVELHGEVPIELDIQV